MCIFFDKALIVNRKKKRLVSLLKTQAMLKERESVISKISVVLQVIITLICFSVVTWFTTTRYGFEEQFINEFNYSLIIISIFWFFLLEKSGKGNLDRIKNGWKVFTGYFKIISIGLGFLIALNLIVSFSSLRVLNLALFSITNLVLLIIYKHSLHAFIRFFRRKGL